jgi:predicted nucleic acid-binding protein
MTVLIDSDILIEVSRGRNRAVVSTWIELSTSSAAVLYSPVSVAELWAGARPGEYDALRNLFRALTCAPIDEEVAVRLALICSDTGGAMASKSPTP